MENAQTPDMFPETVKQPKFKRGDVVRLNSTHEVLGALLAISMVIAFYTDPAP